MPVDCLECQLASLGGEENGFGSITKSLGVSNDYVCLWKPSYWPTMEGHESVTPLIGWFLASVMPHPRHVRTANSFLNNKGRACQSLLHMKLLSN